MLRNRSLGFLLTVGVATGVVPGGSAKREAPAPAVASEAAVPTPEGGGKIPVTTSSTEARTEFLKGRDMAEKLLITDSHSHFARAASLDPNFASAELSEFERGLKLVEGSNLSAEIKNNALLVHHYNLARVLSGKRDLAGAKSQADEFRKGAAASRNPAQAKQAHELDGIIALAERDYDKAVAELQQANQQNPQNLYRLCQAYQARKDAGKAKEFCARAVNFNSLPQINYAFIRTKAKAAWRG